MHRDPGPGSELWRALFPDPGPGRLGQSSKPHLPQGLPEGSPQQGQLRECPVGVFRDRDLGPQGLLT